MEEKKMTAEREVAILERHIEKVGEEKALRECYESIWHLASTVLNARVEEIQKARYAHDVSAAAIALEVVQLIMGEHPEVEEEMLLSMENEDKEE